MTDIELFRLLCWPGVALSLIALWFCVKPLAESNGTMPICMVTIGLALIMILWALAVTDLTYGLSTINSTGRHYYEALFARVLVYPASGMLIWLGWWMRRKQK